LGRKFLEIVLHAGSVLVVACALTSKADPYLRSDRASVDVLQKTISGPALRSAVLTEAFGRTLSAAQVPGGIAVVEGCQEESARDFPPLGPTLQDALTAIQRVVPSYRWRMEDSVVNMTPTDGFPLLLRTLLHEFSSKDANNLTWAASLLVVMPEIRETMSRLGFRQAPNQVELGFSTVPKSGTSSPPEDPPLGVRCKNCSFYDVLNTLVRVKGGGTWIYQERHCSGINTFRLAFSD